MYVVFAANLTAKAAVTDKTQSYSSVTYDDYISQAPDNNRPDVKIEIDAVKYNSATADIRVVSEADEISGETSQGLYCGDTGTVDWSFYAWLSEPPPRLTRTVIMSLKNIFRTL